MDPKAIIDSYVGDVVRRLPRRQRNDVGFELRSLLNEELDGRAADAGRPADDAMAIDILAAFGRPQDVADRYRPAGFTVIRPADAPAFAWWALGGVALQWAVTLPAAFTGPARTDLWAYGADAWWGRLALWWPTFGLGAFWWPGFLITLTLIAAMLGHGRAAEERPWTPPRTVDRDLVNRTGLVAGMAFWLLGMTLMIALPWLGVWGPSLPEPLVQALAFDPEFLARRAPWVLILWAASFAVYGAVLVAGRWTGDTRRINTGLNLAWLVLLGWWLSGRIMAAEAADSTAKASLLVIVLIVLLDLFVSWRRHAARLRPPVA